LVFFSFRYPLPPPPPQGHPCLILRARPFPSKENRLLERDDLGPPFVPGGQEIGFGSRNLERAGRWLGRTGDGLGPFCVAERRAVPQGQTDSGGSVLAAIC